MATQLLNGVADIVAIQEQLDHPGIALTMRYSIRSTPKTQHDYYRVMEKLEAVHDVSTTIILAIPLKKAKEQLIDSSKIVPCLSGLQKLTNT